MEYLAGRLGIVDASRVKHAYRPLGALEPQPSDPLLVVFGNVSDLRFLISALLIVSGVFPQRCAFIVPPLGLCLHHHDDLSSWTTVLGFFINAVGVRAYTRRS